MNALLRALVVTALALLAVAARADSVVYSRDANPILSTDWRDLGLGPAGIQVISEKAVYIAAADTKPSLTAIGFKLDKSMGQKLFDKPQHLWARAAADATADSSPTIVVMLLTNVRSSPGSAASTAITIQGNASGIAVPVQAVDGATGSGSASSAAVFSNMPVDMTGATALYLTFTAVGSGTVVFEGSNDAVNWAPVTAIRVDSSSGAAAQASASAVGTTFMLPGIAQQVRARVSIYSSGTFNATWVKKATPPFAGLAALTAAYGVPATTVKTTGGVAATLARIQSAASTNATSAKASTATLYSLAVANNGASAAYLKLYNKASSPTVGTDTPVATIMIPAGGSANVPLNDVGVSFSAGLAYAITGGAADSDTTAVTANQVTGFLSYS